ncbi:angiotensin-converting enzyme [Rhipicephalus sanguineus]|uniref:angiotensin-converting enzyme n=1 Tax=Rhipicephalus sanguineus TaxID=34632 RepID=UPI001893C171|nr:angiotensin-converting enzyme [Rhipicephalus sanguineus]
MATHGRASVVFGGLLLVVLSSCVLVGHVTSAARVPVEGTLEDEEQAKAYLKDVEAMLTEVCLDVSYARWNHSVNLTEHNKNKSIDASLKMSRLNKEIWKNVTKFKWTTFKDEQTRTIFKRTSVLGSAILPDDEKRELVQIIADMSQNHASAKICPFKRNCTSAEKCNIPLDPVIKDTLEDSRNYEELLHVWNEWRKVSGKPVKEKFLRYVELENKAAKLNGFEDASQMWQETYEYEGFEESMARLWKQLEPLYKQLHAYVRAKLIDVYGDKIKADGPIPAHLLGHIHSQHWHALNEITKPFPNKKAVNITVTMREKNMTVIDMFRLAEEFFTSLGLPPMPESFWENSLLVKPDDREVVCHASAWDFCGTGDVRIKQCTQVKADDLRVVHHEMGHIEYYMQYKHLHVLLQEGANEGFHEAVGDLIGLSVSTKTHYEKLQLMKPTDKYNAVDILLMSALDKIAFLPFGYLLDKWRWTIFTGETPFDKMNEKFWEYRIKYQGVSPPIKRNESFFDGGAKYHVALHVPYLRYFVAFILQFQFHEHLCTVAKKIDDQHPFHECDIYGEKAAGDVLKKGLSLGRSKPWPDVLEIMAGTRQMSASSLKKYYEPLEKWLDERIKNEEVGWDKANVQDYMGVPSFANKVDLSAGTVLASIVVVLSCWKNSSL